MRCRSWVIITPPKRDDPIYASETIYGFSAAKRLRSTGVITHNLIVVRELGSKVLDGCARDLLRMQDEICWSALADDFRTFLLGACNVELAVSAV
jgi:hypothetical protein